MDIEYKIDNKFKNYDLFLFVTAYKKKIKEKPMTKVRRYTSVLLKWTLLILLILAVICFIISSINNNINVGAIVEIGIYLVLFILLTIVFIYAQYKNIYNKELNSVNGKIRIDEKGITDISDVHTVTFPYDQIEFVLLYNDLAFIIHKSSSVNMLIMNYDKKKLLEALNKYNKDLLVIQQVRKEG